MMEEQVNAFKRKNNLERVVMVNLLSTEKFCEVGDVHRTIDASGKGMLELRALSPLLQEASLEGQADVDVSVSGPLSSPASRGTVEVRGAILRVREVPQALTDINGTLTLDGRRIILQNMTGKDSNTIARAALPFFGCLVLCIVLITVFPDIVTVLPNMVMGKDK